LKQGHISVERRKEMIRERFDGKERRAYVRLKRSLPVRFKINGGTNGQNLFGKDPEYQPGRAVCGNCQ